MTRPPGRDRLHATSFTVRAGASVLNSSARDGIWEAASFPDQRWYLGIVCQASTECPALGRVDEFDRA